MLLEMSVGWLGSVVCLDPFSGLGMVDAFVGRAAGCRVLLLVLPIWDRRRIEGYR